MIAAIMATDDQKTDKPAKRPRKAYDLEDSLHEALVRRAARRTIDCRRPVGVSEALAEILREALADELTELADAPACDKPKAPRGRHGKGPKP